MVRTLLSLSLVALLVGGTWGYAHYKNTNYRNFRAVREDVLYRSGQLTPRGLKLVLRDYEIKTIISLRPSDETGERAPDWREEEYCKKEGIKFVRILPRTWSRPDGGIPAEEGVKQFLAVMDDPSNYPVLMHCFRGVHRSGAFTAIYRMEYDGWGNKEAIEEMCRLGYTESDIEKDKDLREFLESYTPRKKRVK